MKEEVKGRHNTYIFQKLFVRKVILTAIICESFT